jgi:hypothetical protein
MAFESMRGRYCGECRSQQVMFTSCTDGAAFYFGPTLDVIDAMTFEAILN